MSARDDVRELTGIALAAQARAAAAQERIESLEAELADVRAAVSVAQGELHYCIDSSVNHYARGCAQEALRVLGRAGVDS